MHLKDLADLNPLSERIIRAAFRVSNALGTGFLEKVYENALAIELREGGFRVVQQAPLSIRYKGRPVGNYFADLLVADAVIVELKAARGVGAAHEAQCLNYLRGAGLRLCLLLNFSSPRVNVHRIVNSP